MKHFQKRDQKNIISEILFYIYTSAQIKGSKVKISKIKVPEIKLFEFLCGYMWLFFR